MNKGFKKLAEQSGIWFEDIKTVRTHSVSTTTLEKFAESIVNQCVFELVYESTLQPTQQVQDFTVCVADKIKK
jgi:hypothetical protein